MTERELEEYRQLRATIRERGTARVWVFLAGSSVWAALTLAITSIALPPAASLVPLLVLAGAFEAVFGLHTGVERIGRYVQVFHETESGNSAQWEGAAMAFRPEPGSARIDPLFGRLFAVGTILNLIPVVAVGAVPVEWAVVGAAHIAFVGRVAVAARQAASQRARDLESFRKLKASGPARS